MADLTNQDVRNPGSRPSSTKSAKPLAGVTVLDFSRVLSGPFCTMLLADMGAQVVKIEPPSGDETRTWGPPFLNSESAYFMSINRNKRSMTLDLSAVEGQAIAHRLAERADIVIENFRPGKTTKLGIDYGTLSALRPDLIYCSISGFGQESPLVDRPGYDFIAQAMSGMMSLTGSANGEAVKAGVPTADLVTGLYAAISILAALHRRDETGNGGYIDISLFDSQLSLAAQTAANYLISGHAPQRYGNAHPNIVPYQSFPTKDGEIAVAVGNHTQFVRFCEALGHSEWADDSRFSSNQLRNIHREELIPLIASVTRQQSTAHWGDAFSVAQIPNGPIQSIPEALDMDHVKARDLIWSMQHPQTGEIRVLGNPMKFQGTPLSAELPPPRLGEHSSEILRELGYTPAEMTVLEEHGIVGKQ